MVSEGSRPFSPDNTRTQEAAVMTRQLFHTDVGMVSYIRSPLTLQCWHLHKPTRCHETDTIRQIKADLALPECCQLPYTGGRPCSRCITITINLTWHPASNGQLTNHQNRQTAKFCDKDTHWLCTDSCQRLMQSADSNKAGSDMTRASANKGWGTAVQLTSGCRLSSQGFFFGDLCPRLC